MSPSQLVIEGVECCAPRAGAQMRLVCFPHAGAVGAGVYRPWASKLGPCIELWTVTLPGRGARAREPFAREWRPLVEELAEATATQVPEPYALFGHSLGAALAFEVARTLSGRGLPPTDLIVSARGAPDITQPFDVPPSDEEFLRRIEQLYGGVPAPLREHPEVLQHFLPMLRADVELAAGYVYEPRALLSAPITAFAGEQDRTLSRRQLEGWSRHTEADFECSWLPAAHFYPPAQERLLIERIARRLT